MGTVDTEELMMGPVVIPPPPGDTPLRRRCKLSQYVPMQPMQSPGRRQPVGARVGADGFSPNARTDDRRLKNQPMPARPHPVG